MAELLFYLLSAAAVGFAACVITARSPMISVLSLLGTFVCLATIYLLAGFQFLAAAQVLVYAGAIMVLFLFVVMLLNLGDPEAYEDTPTRTLGKKGFAAAAVSAGALCLLGVFAAGTSEVQARSPELVADGIDSLDAIAELLFTRYLLPFEAASLLLLMTMVGVLVLAKRERGAARGAGLNLGGGRPREEGTRT